jgi:hypothetical protein
MHRSNETSFDHLVGDACKVDGTGVGPALDRCVMGGYSRALRLAYVSRFNRGAPDWGLGTAFWNRRQGLRRLFVS